MWHGQSSKMFTKCWFKVKMPVGSFTDQHETSNQLRANVCWIMEERSSKVGFLEEQVGVMFGQVLQLNVMHMPPWEIKHIAQDNLPDSPHASCWFKWILARQARQPAKTAYDVSKWEAKVRRSSNISTSILIELKLTNLEFPTLWSTIEQDGERQVR